MTISAIVTGHREGLLAGPSIASFREAVQEARSNHLEVETLVVLDRPDGVTLSMFESQPSIWDQIIVSDFGDAGLSRNHGIANANGNYVTFLDADDLWSYNWILAASTHIAACPPRTVLHSEMNLIFGGERQIWVHADSDDESFDAGYLSIANYWDALTFCSRALYLETPYRANDFSKGYGHEDWNWNCSTILSGCSHRPVPRTIHFKRRRVGSVSALANARDVVPWPTDLRRSTHWELKSWAGVGK